MSPPPLAVVVGCPRSGTTWLHRLLLTHPDAVGPAAESTLFLVLRSWWANAARTDGAGVTAWLPPGIDAAGVARAFTDRLITEFVASTGTTPVLVIEKTPGHVHDLAAIAACYPDVHVVHLVRDGRDVARSLAEFEHGATSIRGAAQAWVDAIEAADRAAPRLRHFREVRYEDLLADPVEGVGDLLAWLGLRVDDTVRAAVGAAGTRRVSQFNTSGPVGAGKWVELSADDLRDVYAVAGRLLRARGYAGAAEVKGARDR